MNTPKTPKTRDEIRAAILNIKPQSKLITVAGVEVEMRQPTIGDVVSGDTSADRKATVAKMLTDYTYVPGTNEKVFDNTDTEIILGLPFGADWQTINNAVNELTNLGDMHGVEAGNSGATPAE